MVTIGGLSCGGNRPAVGVLRTQRVEKRKVTYFKLIVPLGGGFACGGSGCAVAGL